MKNSIIIILLTSFNFVLHAQGNFQDSNMKISWRFEDETIIFKIQSPSKGWQAIGFNNNNELRGNYLLMGRIQKEQVEVKEFFVEAPGQYDLIGTDRAVILNYREEANQTMIEFSLPRKTDHKYHLPLDPKLRYHMIYAYSLSDDFQHHSIFRKSTIIHL